MQSIIVLAWLLEPVDSMIFYIYNYNFNTILSVLTFRRTVSESVQTL